MESLYKFLNNYSSLYAEHNGKIIGCIGIVGHGERAQLRWFLLDQHYRGIGLGRKLLQEAID
ncbi:GNAT family N-acetyltransferase [Clostridium cylindrosporum]|uniref:GNAT family N-acetyltransferase n=1 Tax=Clostridium cylindrosporum TaxID=1495 RepID=UPI00065C6B9C